MARAMLLRRLALVATLSLGATAAAAQQQDTLRALLIEYRCQVVDRLERIYEHGDRESARDRFIAVTVPEHRHGYVQCMFVERATHLYCEASSGFYFDKQGAPRTFFHPPETPAALAKLGFSTDDSKGNYSLGREIGARPDFNAMADLILQTLHDGYGARTGTTRLRFNAPFARRANTTCVPVG